LEEEDIIMANGRRKMETSYSLLNNNNIYIYIYIYGYTFGNAESRLFLFAAQCFNTESRGEFRPRQTRQLPRAVDLKGRFLFLVVVK
jgi:hypothetical protein